MTELSPEAKELMRAAREDFSPADPRVTAVRNALQLRIHIARGNGGGGAGGSGAAAAGASGLVRLLGLGLMATLFAAAVTLIGVRELGHRFARDEPAQAAPLMAAAEATAVRASSNDAQRVLEAEREVTRAAAAAADADARAAAAAVQSPSRLAEQKPRAAPAPTREPRPASRSVSVRSAAHAARAPGAERVPASDSRAVDARDPAAATASAVEPAAVAGSQAPANTAADDSLAREVSLLTRARTALAQHAPVKALALLDEHAVLFANGIMRQERLATRVLALCALGRPGDAIAAKRELERIAPRSPHLMRLRTSCAAEDAAGKVN